jgi:YD repeat-containing protein
MARALLSAFALVAVLPLAAQTPTQTTTSTERGDENVGIRAQATSPQPSTTPAGEIRTPREPRAPGSTPRATATPRTPRATAAPRSSGQTARQRAAAAGDPDVYLEVPNLSVDEILLEVDDLEVHLALDARVANLVSLKAGVDASIGNVKLEIRGVEAEAYLTVRLDNVAKILDRTLTTLDNNPQIVERLLSTVDKTVGTVGRTLDNVTAPGGLLTTTVNTLGQTVQRTLDVTGNIVERTLDTTGKLVGEKNVGRLLDLQVVNEVTNAAGQTVRQVRDTSGALIEYTLDKGGKIVNSRVLNAAPGGRR